MPLLGILNSKLSLRASTISTLGLPTSFSANRLPDLMKFFNARRKSYHTDPILIDDVIYTPYRHEQVPATHAGTSYSRQRIKSSHSYVIH